MKSLAVLRRSGWSRPPARPLPCFAAAGLAVAEAAACAALAVTAVAVTAVAALAVAVAVVVAVAVAAAWARGWLSSLRRFVCCFGAACACA